MGASSWSASAVLHQASKIKTAQVGHPMSRGSSDSARHVQKQTACDPLTKSGCTAPAVVTGEASRFSSLRKKSAITAENEKLDLPTTCQMSAYVCLTWLIWDEKADIWHVVGRCSCLLLPITWPAGATSPVLELRSARPAGGVPRAAGGGRSGRSRARAAAQSASAAEGLGGRAVPWWAVFTPVAVTGSNEHPNRGQR